MKLLDTNVIVYARSPRSPFNHWAEEQIANAVATEGAGHRRVLAGISFARVTISPISFTTTLGRSRWRIEQLNAETHHLCSNGGRAPAGFFHRRPCRTSRARAGYK